MSDKQDRRDKPRMPGRPRVTLGDLFSELGQNKAQDENQRGLKVKHVNLSGLTEGDIVDTVYYCSQKNSAMSKTGKPFLNLTVVDRSGEMLVRVFEEAERIGQLFMVGDFIRIHGRVQSYQGNLQIIARDIERIEPDQMNPEDFMPASHMDPEKMAADLRGIIEGLEDGDLRALGLAAMDDPEVGSLFVKAPAAKSMHHSYMSGLLEHTLSMCILADKICAHYKNLNRSMLITGCLFHDIGKIYELGYDVAIEYTDQGKLIGHIALGVLLVERLTEKIGDFPTDKKWLLEHIILSHHGTHEFGSPVVPATVEALIIHHLDNLDAKANASLNFAEKSPEGTEWTDKHFLLGTQIRKTVEALGPLYDYNLPDPDEKSRRK